MEQQNNLVAAHQLKTRYLTKTTITIGAVVVVLGGTILAYALGKHRVFMPGAISIKHRLFAEQCSSCHTPWKPVMTVVANEMCLKCHGVSPHFKDRSVAPAPQCATCHIEHKGKAILDVMSDRACIQCHADLKVKSGPFGFEATILSFTTQHPEFAVTVLLPGQATPERLRLSDKERLVDTASIKLNHKLHLQPNLVGPNGPEQLSCASCHQPDSRGAYMRPVNYEKDCMRCHLLDFDERLPGRTVPHGQQLEEVNRFLRATYAEYHLREGETQLRSSGVGAMKTKGDIDEVHEMVAKAEQVLLQKPDPTTKKGKCALCHVLERVPDSSGVDRSAVVKTAMPERWLPHSVFNHLAHTTVKCAACHEAAPTSQVSRDVLLPRIDSCRLCHFEPGGARAQCVDCHVYHDKTHARKPGDQLYSIEEFKRGPATP